MIKRGYKLKWDRQNLNEKVDLYHLNFEIQSVLPQECHLQDMPDVLDQGELGSCTANATSNALKFCLKKEKKGVFQPSRLFIYYYSRLLEGSVSEDSGASLSDVMKAVSMYGACSENNWGYDISMFKIHPTKDAVFAAKQHIKFNYFKVTQDLQHIKTVICSGFPIVFGIQCFESLESEATISSGNIPMPQPNEKCLGGHAILICGYDDKKREFTILNSWGSKVGKNGYFKMPYDYVLNNKYASDFWMINMFY